MLSIEILNGVSDKGSGGCNEDAFDFVVGGGGAHIWVIDGATPLSSPYVPGAASDAYWYANRLSEALGRIVRRQGPSDTRRVLYSAIEETARAYVQVIGSLENVPRYDWPLAAVSLLALSESKSAGIICDGIHLGDCSVYSYDGHKPAPIWRYRSPYEHLARRTQAVTRDSATMLEALRRRRDEQHSDGQSMVAALNPGIAMIAPTTRHILPPESCVIAMTDGFARIYDDYNLMSDSDVIARCAVGGAASELMSTLRAHEEDARISSYFKPKDDATVLAVRIIH
jgi:hypothetical protein